MRTGRQPAREDWLRAQSKSSDFVKAQRMVDFASATAWFALISRHLRSACRLVLIEIGTLLLSPDRPLHGAFESAYENLRRVLEPAESRRRRASNDYLAIITARGKPLTTSRSWRRSPRLVSSIRPSTTFVGQHGVPSLDAEHSHRAAGLDTVNSALPAGAAELDVGRLPRRQGQPRRQHVQAGGRSARWQYSAQRLCLQSAKCRTQSSRCCAQLCRRAACRRSASSTTGRCTRSGMRRSRRRGAVESC